MKGYVRNGSEKIVSNHFGQKFCLKLSPSSFSFKLFNELYDLIRIIITKHVLSNVGRREFFFFSLTHIKFAN